MRVSRPETLSGFFLSLVVELPSVPVVARDLRDRIARTSVCVCERRLALGLDTLDVERSSRDY